MASSSKANKSAGNPAAPSLNVYKQVAIVRHPNDTVSYEDAEGNTKSLSIQDLSATIHTDVCTYFARVLCVALVAFSLAVRSLLRCEYSVSYPCTFPLLLCSLRRWPKRKRRLIFLSPKSSQSTRMKKISQPTIKLHDPLFDITNKQRKNGNRE